MKQYLSAIVLALPLIASAHVSLLNDQAEHGSTFKFILKIPHGCNGQATDKIVVRLPQSIQAAKPMPKAGWSLNTTQVTLAKPYEMYGKQVTQEVDRITWSGGSLPNAYYDEFVFQARVAAELGALPLPVEQTCGKTTINWSESAEKNEHPAPVLNVVPSKNDGHHHH